MKRLPNFMIGGVAAGGTSFLASILVQHPEIFLPKEMQPEPHYFYKSWEFKKGLPYYLDRWFKNVPESALAVGERSSSYLFGGENIARKIFDVFPKMKFIFTLRNPMERAWANYRFTVLQGLEDLTFDEALLREKERIKAQFGIWSEIQPHNYTGRGLYAEQLKSYIKYFGKDNILCIKSELLSSQTYLELEKIYRFLDLSIFDYHYETPPDHIAVSVIKPKLQMNLRKYFGERFPAIIQAVRKKELFDNFIHSEKDQENISLLSENLSSEKLAMSVSARTYLTKYFSSEIEQLGLMVDFDVSDWN